MGKIDTGVDDRDVDAGTCIGPALGVDAVDPGWQRLLKRDHFAVFADKLDARIASDCSERRTRDLRREPLDRVLVDVQHREAVPAAEISRRGAGITHRIAEHHDVLPGDHMGWRTSLGGDYGSESEGDGEPGDD